MGNTRIYTVISFLLLGYPPQITSWVLHTARGSVAEQNMLENEIVEFGRPRIYWAA